MVAFLLVASTVLFVEPDNSTIYLGYSCLLLSAACYIAAFGRFRRAAEQLNFNIFVTWSACLFLAGTLWSIPPTWASACLGLAALAAITLGARQKCRSLDFHGAVYLAAAGIVSGLPEYVFRALAGPMPERPGWSLLLVSACCLACYAAGKERPGEDWQDQLLHLLPALLAASAFRRAHGPRNPATGRYCLSRRMSFTWPLFALSPYARWHWRLPSVVLAGSAWR